MLDADVTDSVIGEGCVIKVKIKYSSSSDMLYNSTPKPFKLWMQNCKIHHSVVGLRSCISEGAIIEDSLLMGADYYEVNAAAPFVLQAT